MSADNSKTATLDQAHWENGVWHARVTVTARGCVYTSTHVIEGEEDMTDQALTDTILALY